MLFSRRVDARALRVVSASWALGLALAAGACREEGPSRGAGGVASAGAPEPTAQAGADTGGVPGHAGAPSGAGGSDVSAPNAGGGGSAGGDPPDVDPPDVDPPDVDPPDVDPPDVDPPTDGLGLPCAVRDILRARCESCHSKTPVAGTDVTLMSYADLAALSRVVPTVTVAARALHRMKTSVEPMPPAPAGQATKEEIATLQAWMDSGMVATKCELPPDPDANPYDASPTCSSGSFWPGNFTGATWMMPGAACLSCHRQYIASAPLFTVAGTVFKTAHEPDKCYGVPVEVGARIVITDANDVERVLPVAARGNFGDFLPGLALPYRAKIVVGDEERVMLTPQTDGDCNACHSQFGAQGARGRIILP
jgi:hypothetical protein